ncbi:hypothetical protein ANO11243_027080 [Dothideomycetidae sp. 11243]|nr:hypothetical protein ANO11243_027080 [fungal sp. No.11243]
MWGLVALSFAIATAFAAPLDERQAAGPVVTVNNGTVVGSSSMGIDSFKGIPFALPPTGTLRLKPPQSYNHKYPSGTIVATGTPTACPQFYTGVNTSALPADVTALVDQAQAEATSQGEDCLTLNVQRPTGTTSTSKLPVIFWIYGGGFEFGSTQNDDASKFLLQGVTGLAKGHPIVYVSVNYRLNGFGFLAGKELQADGSTNLGLRDQRLGLEWVAENIAAFGGDPTKVTIWGESAGSISVWDQFLINGGDNTYHGKPLFRAGIMDSGSITPAEPVTTKKAQDVYNAVVAAAGCSGSANTLTCLRGLSFGAFQSAVNSLPGIFSYQGLDLSYLPRPDPANSFFSQSPDDATLAGKYAKLPLIIGDQEDEGTLFSLAQFNITNTAQLITYLQSFFPVSGAAQVPGLVATYPDNPIYGSPFRTGVLYNIYPEFKRLAAILGDVTFTLTRRLMLSKVAPTVPCWSYLNSYLYGTPVTGTFHASDVEEDYDDVVYPTPAITYQTYYTSFAYYLNPNTITNAAPLIYWPRYTTNSSMLLQSQSSSNNLLPDTFRSASYAYLAANKGVFKV